MSAGRHEELLEELRTSPRHTLRCSPASLSYVDGDSSKRTLSYEDEPEKHSPQHFMLSDEYQKKCVQMEENKSRPHCKAENSKAQLVQRKQLVHSPVSKNQLDRSLSWGSSSPGSPDSYGAGSEEEEEEQEYGTESWGCIPDKGRDKGCRGLPLCVVM